MNFDEETYVILEGYLNNTLSQAELNDFEQRMATEPALREEVEINRGMNMYLNTTTDEYLSFHPEAKSLEKCFRSSEIQELKERITQGQRIYSDKQNKSKWKKYFYYVAAILVIGLIIGQYFVQNKKSHTMKVLYSSYSNWEDVPAITSKNGIHEGLLSRGVALYQEKKYTKAIDMFTKAMNQSTEMNPHILIYLGVSYVKIDATQKAKDTFELLLQSKTLESHKAYWYIALTSLKLEDRAEALRYLNLVLQNEGNYKYQEAKKLKAFLQK